MDLGTDVWISFDNLSRAGEQFIQAIAAPALAPNRPSWSVQRAADLSVLFHSANAGSNPKRPTVSRELLLAQNMPKVDRIWKLCEVYIGKPYRNDINSVNPAWDSQKGFAYEPSKNYASRQAYDQWMLRSRRDWAVSKVTMVEQPLHGSFIEHTTSGYPSEYQYFPPSSTFNGQDRWSFLVEHKNGKKALVRYQMNPGELEDRSRPEYCKTNLLSYRDGAQFELDESGSDNYTAWQRSATLSALIASAQQTLTSFMTIEADDEITRSE